jgi:hypothetical protein
VGRLLLSSAVVMAGLSAAFYAGWIPIDPSARPFASGLLLVAGVVDALIGLRLLSESA